MELLFDWCASGYSLNEFNFTEKKKWGQKVRGSLGKIQDNVSLFGVAGFMKWSLNYARWVFHRRALRIRFREARIHDFRLLLDLEDVGIGKELSLNGTREEDHLYILKRYLKPGMTVLDCGANIGYYSVMMGKLVGPNGMIYAVEPDPSNCNLLNVNIMLNNLNDRVNTFNFGLSNLTGTEKFYLSVMSNRHTFHPREYCGSSVNILKNEVPIDIPVMTIGAFAEGKRSIDLIRMDIEGYEVEVFLGLLPSLDDKDFKPSILFESHQARYDSDSHDMGEPLHGLFQMGYYVKWLVSDQHRHGGGREAYEEKGYGENHVLVEFPLTDRAIYRNINNNDAANFICNTGWVRAVLLERSM